MRKRNTTSRRTRAGYDTDQLVSLYEKLGRGEDIGVAERNWLRGLLFDIIADRDPRERFYETVPHRVADQDRAFWCAMWIADRTRAGVPDRLTVAEAKAQASIVWNMPGEEQVRRAWLGHHEQAKAMIRETRSPPAMTRVIEWHRIRCNKSG